MTTRVALLVFDGCDLLDLGGPYEVLLTANRLAERHGDPAPFEVVTIGLTTEPVAAYGGLGLVPHQHVDEVDAVDVVVVPGLIDVAAGTGNTELVAAVRRLAADAEVATSVCTGAFLLAEAGVLHGLPATTHHEDLPDLRARDDVGEVVTGHRWVDAGAVITGAGLSSGLDLGLHLVDRLASRELATATATQIEHPWDPAGHHDTR
jgi:transcriptional regulator GlxA family with amidase domain